MPPRFSPAAAYNRNRFENRHRLLCYKKKNTVKTDKTSKTTKDSGATTQHIHAQMILVYALYVMKTATANDRPIPLWIA